MTNKNKTKQTTDNKALFGPLGKYAIVAVIMVSVIVTTAMMLDKQLNNVEQELAILEQEVIDIKTAESGIQVDKETTTVSVEDSVPAVETAEAETIEATTEATNQEVAEIEQAEQLPSTEVAEIEAATSEAVTSEVVESEMITDSSKSVKTIGSQRNMENKARIAANKQEQKQRLSNQFARINKRELQQLEQYKINQDKRIARLRKQNTRQGHIIDALIVRNQELATIRKVNIQKNQTNRAQVLNRI